MNRILWHKTNCELVLNFGFREMFFHIVLERNMQLHPRHFGRDLREKLVSKLMKDVEGTCRLWFAHSVTTLLLPNLSKIMSNFYSSYSGRHGFVVAITGIENVGKGLIRDGTGFVTFPVKYQCVVFRPFKGEILEAVVTMVNKVIYLIQRVFLRKTQFRVLENFRS